MEEQELNIEREDNRYNRHKVNNIESQIIKKSSSLKDLCILLLSSFCDILDEFGLETKADEEMLLMAIDSGDFDSVIEYVKLFKNKISSILILNNIVKDFKAYMETGMTTVPEIIKDIENIKDCEYNNVSDTERNTIEQVINCDKDNIDDDLINDQEFINLKLFSPNTNITSNNNHNIKKSPVPPLNVEKAGPGSWNRGQLPSEYPIE